MSTKSAKSSKKTNEVVPEVSELDTEKIDVIIEVKSELKPKKKSSKKSTSTEQSELVSDSDASFVKVLDKHELPEAVIVESENEGVNSNEGDDKKSSSRKKTNPIILKLKQITKSDFSNLTPEENIIISEYLQLLNNKHTSHLCGKEVDTDKLVISKKGKTKKEVPLDEEGNPIKKDTTNHPLNIKKEPYEKVLELMEIPKDTLISITELRTKFRDIRKETDGNVSGKLKALLEYVVPQRKQIDDSISGEIPEKINNTTDIFKYAAYCFPPKENKKTVTKNDA